MISVNPVLMRSVPLLSALDPGQLTDLLQTAKYCRFERDAYLALAGQLAEGLHVLVSGRASVLIGDAGGRLVMLSVLRASQSFGEAALIDGKPYSTSVKALDACRTLYIPKRAFLDCALKSHAATVLVMRNIAAELRAAEQQVATFALLDVRARVERVLSASAQNVRGEWLVEPGPGAIAAMVGASREVVSRVLSGLAKTGVIGRRNRRIILLDRLAVTHANV